SADPRRHLPGRWDRRRLVDRAPCRRARTETPAIEAPRTTRRFQNNPGTHPRYARIHAGTGHTCPRRPRRRGARWGRSRNPASARRAAAPDRSPGAGKTELPRASIRRAPNTPTDRARHQTRWRRAANKYPRRSAPWDREREDWTNPGAAYLMARGQATAGSRRC